MKDTDRILARNVGRVLTAEETEQVNGTGGTTYSYSTGGNGQPPDTGGGVDYEWGF